MRARFKGRVSREDLLWDGLTEWMSTGKKELADEGSSLLRSAWTGKAGNVSAVAKLFGGVSIKRQTIGDIGWYIDSEVASGPTAGTDTGWKEVKEIKTDSQVKWLSGSLKRTSESNNIE